MNKKVLIILGIAIIICFIVFFIIKLKISNVSESTIEETTEVIEEKENSPKDDAKTREESLMEDIPTNSDIEATKRNAFEGTIVEIDIASNQMIVENPTHIVHHEVFHADRAWRDNHKVIIDGKTWVKAGYLLCLDDVPIKDYKGNEIEIRDLKVGDTIYVKTINIEYVTKIIFETWTSDNIISIQRKSK